MSKLRDEPSAAAMAGCSVQARFPVEPTHQLAEGIRGERPPLLRDQKRGSWRDALQRPPVADDFPLKPVAQENYPSLTTLGYSCT